MRQPKVDRPLGLLLALAIALLLAAPVVQAARDLAVASAFVVEFLGGGRPALLSALTPAPGRRPLSVPGVAVDRYRAPGLGRPAPLVLIHGVTPEGKDDPRARQAADLLARAGFDVAVPTVPGVAMGRLRPGDVEPVVATIAAAATDQPVTVIGVSIGAGPALLAAADPRVRERVAAVVSLGGYASARELLRFFLTGEYAWGAVRGRIQHDPEIVRAFLAANAELIDPETLRRLAAGEPGAAETFLAHPPTDARELLDALSPERVAREIRARLILVHGRGDRAVPHTESLRLQAARPERTTLALVGVVGHVEGPGGRLAWSQMRDFAVLWGVMYGLLARR